MGNLIGLIRHTRRRVYGRSSTYRKSDRADVYVVGRNENGQPYRHQVSSRIANLADAWAWIWGGAEIVARQGDVALAASRLSPTTRGEEADVDVVGHSRHRFLGEVYQNGHLSVRGGFLYHTGEQHPTIPVPRDRWLRVVVGRRSERALSSQD